MAELSIEERVANGMKWLDRELAGWENIIDLDRLDLGSPCNCILGQSFGDFWLAPGVFDGREEQHKLADLGFNCYPPLDMVNPPPSYDARAAEDYAVLTVEWKRVINERRAVSR